MANTIRPKRSYTAAAVPSGLLASELAINAADGKIYIGNAAGSANVLVSSLAFADHTGSISNSQLDTTAVTPASYTNANITINAQGRITAASSGTASGTVTSVAMTVPTGLSVSGSPITSSGTLAVTLTSGYSIPTTTKQTQWDTAYSSYLQWDGGSTSLVAATGRTSLGATTVGGNMFTLTNPTAITFPRFNADNTVSALDAATFRTAIGAGTSSTSGTVTSIATTSPITGGTITSTGTIGINAASANTASYVVQRDASGNFSAGTITATLSGNASTATSATSATTATNLAGGGAGQIPYNTGSGATSFLAAGTTGQVLQSNATSAPSWANIGMPTGALMPYAGSTAPTGYLLCDGSSVSSTSYLALHAIISNTYGGSAYTGAGSLSFNLPDLRGRLPMGAGTGTGLNASGTGAPSGTAQTARTMGQWLGEETHLLTTAELASHTHANTVSGGNTSTAGGSHTHGSGSTGFWVYNSAAAGTIAGGSTYNASAGGSANTAATNIDHSHTFTPSITNVAAGSGSRHDTIPPVVVLNYIIKT